MVVSAVVAGFPMSEVVARTGVNAPTIRFYLAEGLMPPPVRVSANRFLYDERHVEVVRVIRLLRDRRGLSIEAIREVLPEMLPELFDRPETRVFRPEMWRELLVSHDRHDRALSLRDRLLEVALPAFAARGYGEVSIDDIAKAVGIAKGSFYRHFASKEELFFALTERVAEAVLAASRLDLESPAQRVDKLVDALASYAPVIFDLASLSSQGRPGYRAALDRLLSSIQNGLVASGQVRTEQAADLVLGALGQLFDRVRTLPERAADQGTGGTEAR